MHRKTKFQIRPAQLHAARTAAKWRVLKIRQLDAPALLFKAIHAGRAGLAGGGQASQPIGQIVQRQGPAQQRLGEVLWKMGREAEARELWARSLEANPDSDIIRRTQQRFIP